MDDSLQQIEDYYISQGLKGAALRTALESDMQYQTLLKDAWREPLIKSLKQLTQKYL